MINAVLASVPGTFVRDYLHNGGFLQIRRGRKEVGSADSNEVYSVPAETLCYFQPGWTPRTTFVKGAVTKVPGWQVQARLLWGRLNPDERKRVERKLGFPLFRMARGI